MSARIILSRLWFAWCNLAHRVAMQRLHDAQARCDEADDEVAHARGWLAVHLRRERTALDRAEIARIACQRERIRAGWVGQ